MFTPPSYLFGTNRKILAHLTLSIHLVFSPHTTFSFLVVEESMLLLLLLMYFLRTGEYTYIRIYAIRLPVSDCLSLIPSLSFLILFLIFLFDVEK